MRGLPLFAWAATASPLAPAHSVPEDSTGGAGVNVSEPGLGLPFSRFNSDAARVLALLTQVSYCGANENVLRWPCGPCRLAGVQILQGSARFVQHREIWEPNSTFVYVARLVGAPPLGGSCVISFRGSSSQTNWVKDAEVWYRPVPFEWCEGCLVSDGFYTIWKSVKEQIFTALGDIGCVPRLPPPRVQADPSVGGAMVTQDPQREDLGLTNSVFITGHSLGAAVGTIAMCLMQEAGYSVQPSYSFESPRIGNWAFAQAFGRLFDKASPAFRVTHALDPVPHLPPEGLLGFEHVNYEVYYDSFGRRHFCGLTEDPFCANRYTLLEALPFKRDHCASPLAFGGDLCHCPVPTAASRGAGVSPTTLV